MYTPASGSPRSLTLRPDDKNVFCSGSCDGSVRVWDVRAGKCTHTFFGHDSDVNAVDFYPSGNVISSASDDSTCRMFDLRSRGTIAVFSDQMKMGSCVTSIAHSASGSLLFAGYEDNTAVAWETTSQNLCVLRQVPLHFVCILHSSLPPVTGSGTSWGSHETALRELTARAWGTAHACPVWESTPRDRHLPPGRGTSSSWSGPQGTYLSREGACFVSAPSFAFRPRAGACTYKQESARRAGRSGFSPAPGGVKKCTLAQGMSPPRASAWRRPILIHHFLVQRWLTVHSCGGFQSEAKLNN